MLLIFLLLALPLVALDMKYTVTPESAATDAVQTFRVNLDCGAAGAAQGTLPVGKYLAPYISNTKLPTWQNDRESWCANGSLMHVIVSFPFTGSSGTPVELRPDDNPCSAGNRTACDDAGLNQAGMLGFNGGTWSTSLVVTPSPLGSATAHTFDARAVLSAGRWIYTLRGPALTQAAVGDRSTSRLDDFGWKQHHVAMLGGVISNSSATSLTVNDASQWAGLARPFEIAVGGGQGPDYWESMLVCFVSGNTLYVGNSNGADSNCANVNGRGAGGTTATSHSPTTDGSFVLLRGSDDALQGQFFSGTVSLTLNDASGINSVTVLQVGTEMVRVCNRSGNTLTVGTGAWGCTPGDTGGRNWRGTAYGFGTGTHVWAKGVPVRLIDSMTDRWRNAPADIFKSLHPTALVSFPAGWGGVNVQYRLESGWLDRLQDQQYDVAVVANGATLYSQIAVRQSIAQTLFFPVWDPATPGLRGVWAGATPPTVEVDFNHRWCVSIGLCPGDPDLTLSEADVSTLLNNGYSSSIGTAPAWTSANNSKCAADTVAYMDGAYWQYFGPLIRPTNAPGARSDIGYMPQFPAVAARAFSITGSTGRLMRQMAGSLSACAGIVPIHYLDHRTSQPFCNGGGYTAAPNDKACSGATNQSMTTFGLFPSITAYPTMNPSNQTNAAVRVVPVGAASRNGIMSTIPGAWSHMPSAAFWDAINSGNWFVDEIVIAQAGNMAMISNAYPQTLATDTSSDRSKHRGPFGLVNSNDGARTRPWPLRDMFFGWYISPRGNARNQYLEWVLKMNFAGFEGSYNWTGGPGYIPCQDGASATSNADITYSPWCFGRMTRGMNSTMNYLWPSEPGTGYIISGNVNTARTHSLMGTFMYYYELIAYPMMGRYLPFAAPFAREYTARMLTARMLAEGANPWMVSAFQLANNSCSPEGVDVSGGCAGQAMTIGRFQGFSSIANWKAAASTTSQTQTGPDEPTYAQSRTFLVLAATRVSPRADYGSLSARRAREFWAAAPGQHTFVSQRDPSWAVALWERPDVSVTVGDTSARFTATTLYGACKLAVQSSAFSQFDDAAHTAATMAANRLEHSVSGLAPGTLHYYMVTCGDLARTMGTFTTLAATSAARTLPISLKPPSGRGIDNVLVAHGPTSALGSSVTASCASGCTPTISGLTAGKAVFFQVTYRDASNNALAVGRITSRIVQ